MAVDNWTDAEWRHFYKIRDGRPGSPTLGQRLQGYGREYYRILNYSDTDHLKSFRRRWANLIASFPGIQPNDRVLVVGAAFGFLIEAAKEAGYPNVWGLDNSPDVEARKGVEAAPGIIIVNADVRGIGGQVRNTLRQLTGDDQFDWVITEDMASCYSDAEVQSMAPLLENLLFAGRPASNVIHVTSCLREGETRSDLLLTWHTLAEWRALVPSHSWADSEGVA